MKTYGLKLMSCTKPRTFTFRSLFLILELLLARIVFVVADEAASFTDSLGLAVEVRMRRAIAEQVRASLASIDGSIVLKFLLSSQIELIVRHVR
jgi:hypothetical protein